MYGLVLSPSLSFCLSILARARSFYGLSLSLTVPVPRASSHSFLKYLSLSQTHCLFPSSLSDSHPTSLVASLSHLFSPSHSLSLYFTRSVSPWLCLSFAE